MCNDCVINTCIQHVLVRFVSPNQPSSNSTKMQVDNRPLQEFMKFLTDPYQKLHHHVHIQPSRDTMYDDDSSSEDEDELRMTARSLSNMGSREIFRYNSLKIY
jgi:hypothetical protein